MAVPPGVTPLQQAAPQTAPQQQAPQQQAPPGVTPLAAPPGVTPVQPQQQPQEQATQLPQVSPLGNIQQTISDAAGTFARQQGVPANLMRTMAAIETGGERDPANTVNPSKHKGVYQFDDASFAQYEPHGNIFSVTDNTEAAAKYMKWLHNRYGSWTLAAGAFNTGPGNMDAILAGKQHASEETLKYMAHAQAAVVGQKDLPLPDDHRNKNVPKGLAPGLDPGRAKQQKDSNMDPRLARKGWLQQIAGHQDLPFIWWNAKRMDDTLNPGRSDHVNDAMKLWFHNPAAAQDLYGLNAQPMSKFYMDHGSDAERNYAKWLTDHPWGAAGATFIEEMFNPMSWAEGAGVGKMFSIAGRGLMGLEEGRRLLSLASPYHEITTLWGANARNIIASAGAQAQHHVTEIDDEVHQIFGGLTLRQKRDVVHASQQSVSAMHEVTPDLLKRGQLLRDKIKAHTNAAVNDKALTPNQVYDTGAYFPMHGAFKDAAKDEETQDFIGMMGGQHSEFRNPAAGRKYRTLAEANVFSNQGIKTSWDPAVAYQKHFSTQGGNRAFVQMMEKLSKKYPGMVRDMPHDYWDVVRDGVAAGHAMPELPRGQGIGNFGKGRDLTNMIRMQQALKQSINNPTLSNLVVAPEFAKWMERGQGMMRGAPTTGFNRGWNNYNNLMRFNIMYNPQYHPFWNIVRNYAAASGAHVGEWMYSYMRVLGHQLGLSSGMEKLAPGIGGHVGQAIQDGAAKLSQDIADAAKAGAMASFGGGQSMFQTAEGAAIRTMPWDVKGLFGATGGQAAKEQWDKTFTAVADWNRKMTFSRHGEAVFAAELFKKMVGRGMEKEDAAWAVREALGNYQNVDPNSWQSKLMFFYPWLKTNLPFWAKTFVQKPQYLAAPTSAFMRQRQYAGDPNVESASFVPGNERAYLGRHGQEDLYWSMPDPANMFDHALRAMGPVDTPLRERIQESSSLILNRGNPVMSEVSDSILTANEHAGAEPGDYRGYEVMWNTNMPFGTSLKQWLGTSMGKVLPIPVPYMTRQMIRDGFHSSRWPEYLMEAASMGTISHAKSEQYSRQVKRIERIRSNAVGKMVKRQTQSSQPMPQEEMQKRVQALMDRTQKDLDRIKAQAEGDGVPVGAMDQAEDHRQAQDVSAPPGVTPVPPGVTPQ